MRKRIFHIIFPIAFVFLLVFVVSNYATAFPEDKEKINQYSERESRVLETRLRDQFYILSETISEEYIEQFNENSEGYVKLFYEQVADILPIPRDEREDMFHNALEPGMTLLFPATFENTRKSLLATIDYHNLNPNAELDEDLKEAWSKGSIRTVRQDFAPLSRDANSVVTNSRYGRIRLDENTAVKLIYWHIFTTIPTFHNPYFAQSLWEFVEILDGEHAGRTGWIPHYFLS